MTAHRKFPQVDHAEAAGELKEIYGGHAGHLAGRVGGVCLPRARHLPRLPPARLARGQAQLRDALCRAGRRRAARAGPAPPDPRPELRESGWDDARIDKVRHALDVLNYGNPKYMLLITAWSEEIQGRSSGGEDLPPEDAVPIPHGLPEGVAPLRLVDPDDASADVQALFERVTGSHLHHGPSSDYRVLAAWPDYLRLALDGALEPVVRTEEYDALARALLVRARELVRGFSAPAGIGRDALADSCSPSEIAGLTGLLFMYQRFICDVTIDMVRLKQALDGPEAATASPFPTP